MLSVDELLALLAAIGSLRDRVLLTVLYSAGIHLGEVCRLRVDDIDSHRMLLLIRQGKGHKDRFAPLSPIALELLRQWWRATRPMGLLFQNKKDPSRPINPSTVQRAVKIATRRAGITKPVSPRTLQHDDPFFRNGNTRGLEPDIGDRHQIRAAWLAPDAPDMPQCARAKFIASVEIFDKNGRTTVLYPGFLAPDTGDTPSPR